jgi:transposase
MSILDVALDPATVVVAVDPGKVMNRVWVSDGSGLLADPVSLPVAREGIAALERLLSAHRGFGPVIAIEATGSLHRAWAGELERLHPGGVRLFAPSETKAARTQLGSGRFKTDDRDCAALTYLARQGAGRPQAPEGAVDALRAGVRHRRGLVADRKVAQQRMHDQLNTLCPVFLRLLVMGASCRSRPRLAKLCWPARPPSPAGHPRSGRWSHGPRAG